MRRILADVLIFLQTVERSCRA